jgi:hypothetical protein
MPRNNNFLALGNAGKVAFFVRDRVDPQSRECSFFTINQVRISRSDLGVQCGSRTGSQKADDGQD